MTANVKVLLLLFDGFNTLDVNGPLEIFNKSDFTVDIAADFNPKATPPGTVTAFEGAIMTPNKVLSEELFEQLSSYDILVVPGSNSEPVSAQIAKPGPWFNKFILTFANLPAKSDKSSGLPKKRILLSVCTGALIVASLGIFNSAATQPPIYCTTHWMAYAPLLNNINTAVAKTPGKAPGIVLPARFVDNGPAKTPFQQGVSQVRIVSSGGVSCSLDASLHVVKLMTSYDVAHKTAMMIDYAWRQTEGVVFNDESIYKPAVVPQK